VFKRPEAPGPASVLRRMTDVVAHRGPDDSGHEWFGADGRRSPVPDPTSHDWSVGLGHRRLAILDLSPAGHQPMSYRQRFWISYNGEVYNYLELKAQLSALGHSFCSTSDTEVILAAFAEWGPDCFARFRGMWALAIYDTARGTVFLSRDRLGIKPHYLWRTEGLVAIASEIKQLLDLPGFPRKAQLNACALYVLTGYEDPLGSLFQDVQQVAPGSWLSIDVRALKVNATQAYWFPGRFQPTIKNPEEADRIFAEKLDESVALHLRSDVPVGCALSGGLDSSSIALLINQQHGGTDSRLNTFSAVFPGFARDERAFVDLVLGQITARPSFVTPSAESFLEEIGRFTWIHDEPTGSCSQYAGYCISRSMREARIPVALNGQGGDEVLGGYWQLYFAYLLGLLRQGRVMALSGHFLGSLCPGGNPHLAGQTLSMWKRYRSRSDPPPFLKFRGVDPASALAGSKISRYLKLDPQAQRLSQITDMFLPQLLKWDDRNFMAFSVEGRYPFLDHELIETCLQFQPRILYHRGWTKCPLRNGLRELLPPPLRWRRSKFGFETPQDAWLRGPLRPVLDGWLGADRPVWSWVGREAAKRVAEQAWASPAGKSEVGDEAGQVLFRLFALDRWLEQFSLSLS
jgi:asparagine synthase (glutamine-hydrolysing)